MYIDQLRKKHRPWVYDVGWKSSGTGKAYQILMPSLCGTNGYELLHVSGDGTNKLRVGLDWEHRGLVPGLGDVLRRKLDEVVEVPADLVQRA